MLYLISEALPGGGVPFPLLPWKKSAFFPCSLKSKIWFSIFPVPQNCICSPVPFSFFTFVPLFPWKMALCPCSPKSLGGPYQWNIPAQHEKLRFIWISPRNVKTSRSFINAFLHVRTQCDTLNLHALFKCMLPHSGETSYDNQKSHEEKALRTFRRINFSVRMPYVFWRPTAEVSLWSTTYVSE